MNPYDFVRVDWKTPPRREEPIWHLRQAHQQDIKLYSGRIKFNLYAETPLMILDPQSSSDITKKPRTSKKNSGGEYIIPGSSLKGVLRSVVEAVGNGCFTLLKDEAPSRYREEGSAWKNKTDPRFNACNDNKRLCPSCRIFGMSADRQNRNKPQQGENVFLGKISIEDARPLENPYEYTAFYTPVLDQPKTRHTAFYLDEGQQHIAGRKFYFHQQLDPLTEPGLKPIPKKEGEYRNSYIQPLDRDTAFISQISFTNLTRSEYTALLFALTLRSDKATMYHKLGYGKPIGLGSASIVPFELLLIDPKERYTKPGETAPLKEEALESEITNQTGYFRSEIAIPGALEDLERIWRWDPTDGTDYRYPTQDWFKRNSQKRIKDTIDAL